MKTKSVLTIIGAAALLAACGGGEEAKEKKMEAEAARHGIDADVELDDEGEVESIAIKGGLGTVGKNLSLPDGFPADIPVDDGWSVISTSAVPGQENGFMIQAMSEQGVEDVVEAVRAGMSSTGWEEAGADQVSPQMSRVGFEKDGRMTNFVVMDAGGKSSVQIVTMKKPG